MGTKLIADRFSRFPLWVSAVAPVTFGVWTVLLLDSAVSHLRGRVEWKGRRDPETHQAYLDQPIRNGHHYRLDEDCSEQEKQAWREWCRKYPRHWPRHVHDYVARVKFHASTGERRG